MAHLTEQKGTPFYDETEEYDKKHGVRTLADEQKSAGLTEASNKPAPEKVSFKVTTK